MNIFRMSLHAGANLLCNQVKFPTLAEKEDASEGLQREILSTSVEMPQL